MSVKDRVSDTRGTSRAFIWGGGGDNEFLKNSNVSLKCRRFTFQIIHVHILVASYLLERAHWSETEPGRGLVGAVGGLMEPHGAFIISRGEGLTACCGTNICLISMETASAVGTTKTVAATSPKEEPRFREVQDKT